MKHRSFFAVLTAILTLAFSTYSQSQGVEVTELGDDKDMVETRMPGSPGRSFVIFEAVLPASSEAGCFANNNFSSAKRVGPSRATIGYDFSTSSYVLRWQVERPSREGCRVVFARETTSSGDYAVWQSNFGSGGRSAGEKTLEENGIRMEMADGSVRQLSYSVAYMINTTQGW